MVRDLPLDEGHELDEDRESVQDLPLGEDRELVQDPQLDVGRCDFYDAVHG